MKIEKTMKAGIMMKPEEVQESLERVIDETVARMIFEGRVAKEDEHKVSALTARLMEATVASAAMTASVNNVDEMVLVRCVMESIAKWNAAIDEHIEKRKAGGVN